MRRITSGPLQTNTYVLFVDGGAVVVDPGPGSFAPIVSALHESGGALRAIWLTHSHWDHTADCSRLLSRWDVPLCIHEADAENLICPGADGLPSPMPVAPVIPSHYFQDGEVLEDSWTVIHTPGHSLGSVCLYREGVLLSGDTLFRGTMGNVSFPFSSPALMADSLERLCSLPDHVQVFPGHGPATTIARERPWMVTEAQRLRPKI